MNWKKIEDHRPACTELGEWDGARSEWCLCKLKDGTYSVGRMYAGYMDGSEFAEWYDKSDYELSDVVEYVLID